MPSIGWGPRHSEVFVVSANERDLYVSRDSASAFHEFEFPKREGIHGGGEFPVAVVRKAHRSAATIAGYRRSHGPASVNAGAADRAGIRRAQDVARADSAADDGGPSAGHVPDGQRPAFLRRRSLSSDARRAEPVHLRRQQHGHVGSWSAHGDHLGARVPSGRTDRRFRATRRGLAVVQAGSVDVDEIQPVIQRLGEGVRGDSSQEHAARARNHSDASAAAPLDSPN